MNLFQWLDGLSIYPKIYWKGKDEEIEYAAAGKSLEWDTPPDPIPQARIWGGKAFSKPEGIWREFPESIFFQPAFEIVQPRPSFAQEKKEPPSIQSRHDLPAYPEWKKIVRDFLQNKERIGLEKLVLARQTTLELSHAPSPFQLLSQLEQKNATLFGIQFAPDQAFIGATPEKLYQRIGNKIYSEAIAGTRPLSDDQLLHSKKDQKEFDYVKEYIKKALAPLCSHLTEGKLELLATAHVHHLRISFQGELYPSITDAMLLEALHPTPAVNGFPKQAAYDYLAQVEPFHRGWYAAALGYISEEKADFAVGIRCALIDGNKLHLYAGGGLVDGSCPQAEWEEREHKIALFKSALRC
ncbi:MAG TPA: isochorismate synthase [Rhabdochlamydiaceae bacterium]|nr:isochorismate synthase [Rhabdochlamydiaceae bacterium]